MTSNIINSTIFVGRVTIKANKVAVKEGQVIEAWVIEKASEGTKFLLNEQVIQVGKETPIAEIVGQKASFLVEQVEKEVITLKYIQPEGLAADRSPIILPKMKTTKLNPSFEYKIRDNISNVDLAKGQELEQMAVALKGKIEQIVETATDEDVKAIIKDHYNIEKITIDMFKALVDQNKIALRMDNHESLKAAIEETVASFEADFKSKFGDTNQLRTIVTALKEANLPVQMKNIEKVQMAVTYYQSLSQLSEEQTLNVLRNQKPFTLEEVAKVITLPAQKVVVPQEILNLTPQVRQILKKNGIETNTKNIMLAHKIIAANIPLDENTLTKLKALESGTVFKSKEEKLGTVFKSPEVNAQSVEAVKQQGIEAVIKEAVINLANKLPAARINLPIEIQLKEKTPVDRVAELVKQVEEIKDIEIVKVIQAEQIVNLKNIYAAKISDENSSIEENKSVQGDYPKLQEDLTTTTRVTLEQRDGASGLIETPVGQEELQKIEPHWTDISMVVSKIAQNSNAFRLNQSVEMTVETLNANAKTMVNEASDLQFIKARLCIEELRLKMTYESATRLIEKGIAIDIEPLEALVEHLKTLQQEGYTKALEVHQVRANEVNLRQMEETMTAVSKLAAIGTQIKVEVLNSERPFTLEALTHGEVVAKESELFQTALNRYETMETEVRPDLGDSIEKAFQQIGKILEQLGLDNSLDNIRVAKALAKSETPITIEAIEGIKLIDAKISLLTDALKPTMVAAMIKEQINPINMSIDSLTEFVRGYGDAFLNTDTEQLAAAILEVKKSEDLNAEQKESLMGIYRMLRTISKSKGTAAAFLVKKNLPLNIKNLFEAAKYMTATKRNANKIEANIDDNFGILERLEYKGENISEQVKKALMNDKTPQTKHQVDLMTEMDGEKLPLTTENRTKAEQHHVTLERFFQHFSHENMKALMKEGHLSDYEKPLTALTELMVKENQPMEGKATIKEIVDQLSEMVKMDVQMLKTFEKYGMKVSTSQLFTHFMLKENPFEMSQVMNQLFENMEREGLDGNPLRRQMDLLIQSTLGDDYEKVLENIKSELGKVRESALNQQGNQGQDSQRQFSQSGQIIEYQQQIMKQEDYYQIPIWMDEQWVQLNLYYQNHSENEYAKAEDEMDIYLFFETKAMGSVQSHMHLKDKKMQFSIYSEAAEDRSRLQSYQTQLMDILNQDGFEVEDIGYDYFKAKSPIDEGQEKDNKDQIRYIDSKFIASV